MTVEHLSPQRHAPRPALLGALLGVLLEVPDALLEVLGTSPSRHDAVAYRAFARVARRVGEQKTDFGRDRTFFFALRNKNEDPSELDLQFLKEYWPVLADKSDAEIIEALAPIKAIEVDYRTVAANAGPRNPGPTY